MGSTTEQTAVVELVTNFVPSPVVDTDGTKPRPLLADDGRLEIDGVEAVPRPTSKLWAVPSAAA